MSRDWLGLDIGGANLKAWCNGRAGSWPFELWKNPEGLAFQIGQIGHEYASVSGVAITMTGELCDCFDSRQDGVAHIVGAVEQSFPDHRILVYQTTGEFVTAATAIEFWRETAAANWHAIAMSVMQFIPDQTGILLDIGSTTTDLIPFRNGEIKAGGKTDFERMRNGELLYTGVQRSPVCAVAHGVDISDKHVLLAQECFASMLDVYVVLGLVDGWGNPVVEQDLVRLGSRTCLEHSMARVARSVCSDLEELGSRTVAEIARQIAVKHQKGIQASINRIMEMHPECACRIVVAGQGEWLAHKLVTQLLPMSQIWRLSELVDDGTSRCAAAWAVSRLAAKCFGAIA